LSLQHSGRDRTDRRSLVWFGRSVAHRHAIPNRTSLYRVHTRERSRREG
jgi:hypothetical protein